jgi:hypothetical protein
MHVGIGSNEKRVIGVEPTTFTLATLPATADKASAQPIVTTLEDSPRTISAQNLRPEEADELTLRDLIAVWPHLSRRVKHALRDLAVSNFK